MGLDDGMTNDEMTNDEMTNDTTTTLNYPRAGFRLGVPMSDIAAHSWR